MRTTIFIIMTILVGVWLNVVLNHYIQVFELKPNWLLVFILILTFRHQSILYPYLGILMGLFCDAFSHGILGIYGLSFFITLLIVQRLSNLFYANTFFAISFAVFSMSLLEGSLGLSILNMLEPELKVKTLLMTTVLPVAVLHGVIAPFSNQMLIWVETTLVGETV